MIDRANKGRTGKTNGRTPGLTTEPIDILKAPTKKCGARNPASKLTEDDVRRIRDRYATGTISQRALAAEYSVHPSLIGFIVRRKYWQHVE